MPIGVFIQDEELELSFFQTQEIFESKNII